MTTEILPNIGASGTWSLKPPFNDKLVANLAYSCKAIRKLSEVVATGMDAKAEFYDKYDLGDDTYNLDVKNDISIITLVSSEGNWLFVPSSYLNGWPSSDTVPYAVVGMLLNLGALPNTIDPSFLSEKVSNVVQANLGHTPEIKFATLSETTNKTWSDHESLEQARQTLISDSNTDYVRRVKAEADLAAAQAHIQALEQYIVDNGMVAPNP